MLNLVVLGFYDLSLKRPYPFKLTDPKELLIIATHQDDCVIQGGGLAIQNAALGGKTTVVYLTRPIEGDIAEVRKREARAAWGRISASETDLMFLDFYSGDPGSVQPRYREAMFALKLEHAAERVEQIINQVRPNLVVIPLFERGNGEHDMLNRMMLKLLEKHPELAYLQAAEYNPYYLAEHSPRKLFWFMVRLLPFVPYREPNFGLFPNRQTVLEMTKEELELKREMLLEFRSQKDVIPLSQFGYPDLFENSVEPPREVIRIGGKFLSPWAVLTLALLVIALILSGVTLAMRTNEKRLQLIVTVFTVLVVILALTNRHLLKEELGYLLFFSAGFLSTAGVRWAIPKLCSPPYRN